jgi:hypothetical protein
MSRSSNKELGKQFGGMFHSRVFVDRHSPEALSEHILEVMAKLATSVYKSADKGDDRGDFAKGREQMAMHAIAMLMGVRNWKYVERIMFPTGSSNGE